MTVRNKDRENGSYSNQGRLPLVSLSFSLSDVTYSLGGAPLGKGCVQK